MDNEKFLQYVVAYKRNEKWYRDSERHQNIKTVTKRLNELKAKNLECKILYREISMWKDIEIKE